MSDCIETDIPSRSCALGDLEPDHGFCTHVFLVIRKSRDIAPNDVSKWI